MANTQPATPALPPPPPAATLDVAVPGEAPFKHFLYLCGPYIFPVFLLSQNGTQVTAIVWQGRRCDCSMQMTSATTMVLNFHYENDLAQIGRAHV